MEQIPLFDRLGGRDGVRAVCERVVDNHLANPVIATRYENASMDREQLVRGATEFFCTGLSGVPTYEGASMPEVHRGMNISDAEFVAVLDDILAALGAEGVGQLEQAEVLAILYGMKGEVVGH
jgi:hemoglobin